MARQPLTAARLFGRDLPGLLRALTPERLRFDRQRRARRLTSLPGRYARPPRGFPPAHRHPHFEICILLGGRCPFLLGDERLDLRGGDVVVLPPEAYHRELAAEQCGPYKLLWLGLHRAYTAAHIQDHRGGGSFDTKAFRQTTTALPEALPLAETLDLELWSGQPGAFTRAQGLLLQLCGLFERALAAPRAAAPAGEDLQKWRVDNAVAYVRDHFAQPIDLSEVAQHAGVGPAYLSALFSRELGRSFTDFVTACRLEAAERLLADPALSIKEVAARVGIANPFYFSRIFRKRAGCSPQAFRRRQQPR